MILTIFMKRFALAVGVLLLLTHNALAQSRAHPQDLFLSPWRPPTGQRCEVLNKPVPSPAAVFDTVGLYPIMTDLKAGSVVLAFAPPDTNWREDYGPRPDSMAVVETTAPNTVSLLIREALLRALKRPVPVPLLVRIDLTEHPLLQVAPALVCRPTVSSQADMQSFRAALRSVGGGPHRALLQIVVRPDGAVTAIRVSTPSDDPQFDHVALTAVSLLRLSPGLLNRVPIPVLVQFPVEVR